MGRQEPAQSAVAAARVPRLDNPLTRRQLLGTMLAAGGLADVVLAQELRRFKVVYASATSGGPLWLAPEKGRFQAHGLEPELVFISGTTASSVTTVGS